MNIKDIKKHKGQLIKLTYNGSNEKIQVGKINAVTFEHVLFKINNELEISIKFDKIKSIESLKTFSHYIRTTKRNMSQLNPQNAIYILDKIRDDFKLESQIKEMQDLRNKCIEMIWKLSKPNSNLL